MRILLTILLVTLLYALPGMARDPSMSANTLETVPAPTEGVYGYRAEQIASGVYALNQGNEFHIQPRGNVEVIEQANGVVLVDSGGSPDGAEQVIAFVSSLTDKPVTAIVITHWHGDHALGISRLLEKWPQARVISTAATRDMLASPDADRFMPGDNAEANAVYHANIEGGVNYLRETSKNATLDEAERAGFALAAREYEQFGREMARAHRVPTTEVFDTSLLLADPTHPVEVKFAGRANTAGDAIAWLPQQKIVITGDVVVLPVPYGFNSYPLEWIDVLRTIRDTGYGVLVPGHGRPLRDTVYIDLLISMLEDVRTQVADMAMTDTDDVSSSKAVNLEAASLELTGGDPWLNRWFLNYWKGPIVSSALREARGQPIIQGSN